MSNIDTNQIAAAVYAAMCAPPDYVQLAHALERADTRSERAALLDGAEPTMREAALRYAAEPETTRERDRRIDWMRADPRRVAALKAYYAEHIADFISDLGVCIDPREVAKGRAALMPFVLWPKQRELVAWMLERWKRGEPGTVVKSRDVGASFVSMAVLASLCLFRRNFAAGICTSTEVKLDRSGDPDTLFYKAREFLRHLPPEFAGGYNEDKNSAYMRIAIPDTGSSITGEAGDQAGRGGRKSLVIVDEAAFFDRPKLIDAALAATTNCRIDCSTCNGIGNPFYERAHNPAIPRLDVTWRDDPRKDASWYARKCAELDPVIVAAEIDCNFAASVEGVVIPSAMVQAAIDLHKRLRIKPSGIRLGALDVADRGQDKNAFAIRHGILLEHVESWSGAGSDLFGTASRAFRLCDDHQLDAFDFDADGLGCGIRGDARVLNEKRAQDAQIRVNEYRGSASPKFPTQKVPRTNRTNADYFQNLKAQNWLHIRMMFQESYKASRGEPYDPDRIISISSSIPELSRLIAELSQATMRESATGKLLIDKIGDGERSPNLADACVCAFGIRQTPMRISPAVMIAVRRG